MASSRLWPAIIATPIAPTTRIGSRASAASTTIDQPIAQITWRPIALQVKLKVQPTVTSDNSTTTSQSPRLTRKTRQLRLASPARRPEIRPGASQKDEARRAEVGDPAGKEEKRRGAGEIA